jgi:predicted RNA-binding protein associated with RNAse of E/G family
LSGDAAWRDVWRGRVWRAQACRLVEESPERIVLFAPAGAATFLPVDENGRRLRIPSDRWTLEPAPSSRDSLCVAPAGAAHSIWHYWEGGRFSHWYVNLEEPLRRTPVGFDTFDHKLDLIVEADGAWRWKDEDELEEAARRGILDPAPIRAEAGRVLAAWPFPTGWEDWRPDPAWPLPELPSGWDTAAL